MRCISCNRRHRPYRAARPSNHLNGLLHLGQSQPDSEEMKRDLSTCPSLEHAADMRYVRRPDSRDVPGLFPICLCSGHQKCSLDAFIVTRVRTCTMSVSRTCTQHVDCSCTDLTMSRAQTSEMSCDCFVHAHAMSIVHGRIVSSMRTCCRHRTCAGEEHRR